MAGAATRFHTDRNHDVGDRANETPARRIQFIAFLMYVQSTAF
jgi:hypothetical protein